jgi:ribulose-phosphate 3-epimerase
MKIAPSVLTADFTNLKEELDSIETADLLHLDIMDGHFVPNISFGPAIAKQIEKNTTLNLDVHLMVTNPYQWIKDFAFKKVKYITIHIESNQVDESIKLIQKHHIGVGISVKPNTKIDQIIPYLKDVDLVLVMTVEPGFGGQSFIMSSLDKVKELVELRKNKGLSFLIEVDGGVNFETAKLAKEAGVDIAVAGSYLFNMKDRKKGMEGIR